MRSWRARAPEAALLREALRGLGAARPQLAEAARTVRRWDEVLALAHDHAVAETVWAALALRGLADAVPPAARAAFEEEHAGATARNALLLSEAAALQAALATEGIASLALKGPGLLAAHYPGIGARHVADLDLLVRPAQVEQAAAAAQRAGARPGSAVDRQGEEGAGGSPLHLPPMTTRGGVALELHHGLPGGGAEVEAVFARAREVAWSGRALRIPSPADLAGIACMHVFEGHHGAERMVPRHLADLAVLFGAGATTWPAVEALYGHAANGWPLRASRALLEDDETPGLAAWLTTAAGRAGGMAALLAQGFRRSPRAGLRVLFPDRRFMAQRYGVPLRSPWLPVLYLWRPVRSALFVLRGR